MFTVSKSALAESSLTPVQQGHVGDPLDQGIIEYLDYQCRQNGRTWCIVSLAQIQANLELTRGLKRCQDTISRHAHRLKAVGLMEIHKRTRQLKDGSLFTGRNLYKLSPRLFDSLERAARKVFDCLSFWRGWKDKYGLFNCSRAPKDKTTTYPPGFSPSDQLRGEKVSDSTFRKRIEYPVGAPLEGLPTGPEKQKGGPSASNSFDQWTPHVWQSLFDQVKRL